MADANELVESFHWPEELADLKDEEPANGAEDGAEEADSWVSFPRKARKPTAAEVLRSIEAERRPFYEIDMRLGAMTPEELDRAMTEAGIDPVAERARGVGVSREGRADDAAMGAEEG